MQPPWARSSVRAMTPMRRPRAAALAFALGTAAAACAAPRPSGLPRDEDWLVVAKSARLPEWWPWYVRFADHTWIDVKRGSEDDWQRCEVLGASFGAVCQAIPAREARRDRRWDGQPVRVQHVVRGDAARAVAADLPRAVAAIAARYDETSYTAWPGPNSNTFVRDLVRELPDLAVAFDHNAVGKDFAWLDAGLAPSRTGAGVYTWPLGATVGLVEGVELHLLQATFGVRLWPPRLALPFLPTLPWDAPPALTAAQRELPEATHVVTAPDALVALGPDGPMDLRLRVEHACEPALRADELLLVRTDDSDAWLSLRAVREAPGPDAPHGAVGLAVTCRDEGRREQALRLPFDAAGRAVAGPFTAGGIVADVTFAAAADGVLRATVRAHRE
jgi:hypothetical protein